MCQTPQVAGTHPCICVQELLAILQGILGSEVAADKPLMEAGLDSIGAVELRNALASKYGVDLPATVTFDYPNLEALAAHVQSKATQIPETKVEIIPTLPTIFLLGDSP